MKITKAWLKEWSACSEGVEWFAGQKETDGLAVCKKLLTEKHWDWANWLIARILGRKGRIRYAVYAAEQVINIYEEKYPDDKRPRNALESAKKVLENDSEENRAASFADSDAANAASSAASSSVFAAHAVASASSAANAASAAKKQEMQLKLLEFGIKLLEVEK